MKLKDIYLFVMNGDFKKYIEDRNIDVAKVQLKLVDIVFGSVGFFPGCDKRVAISCLIDGIMNSLKSTIVEQYITDKITLHNDNYTLVIYDNAGKSYKVDDDLRILYEYTNDLFGKILETDVDDRKSVISTLQAIQKHLKYPLVFTSVELLKDTENLLKELDKSTHDMTEKIIEFLKKAKDYFEQYIKE